MRPRARLEPPAAARSPRPRKTRDRSRDSALLSTDEIRCCSMTLHAGHALRGRSSHATHTRLTRGSGTHPPHEGVETSYSANRSSSGSSARSRCCRAASARAARKKQRALLALLLLRAGEVVSTDELIEELWAGKPPATVGLAPELRLAAPQGARSGARPRRIPATCSSRGRQTDRPLRAARARRGGGTPR